LMIPPGLSFVALSARAIEATKTSTVPKYYFDLRKALVSYEKNDTPWTPAASLVIGVDTALQMIRAEGIENVWRRHARLSTAIRAGVKALGLKLFSDSPSFAVTSVWLPDGIGWKRFNDVLKNTYGVTVAGGQGDYVGRIFRISHLGHCDELDAVSAIAVLERALNDCGWRVEPGGGVRAVQQTFLSMK
jgi:aspartate aminotransferase-like enzyme